MRKFILLLSLLGLLALSTQAADEYTLNLSPVSPQSPTVAAMARQIEYPVSPYTGIPDISIPLYTITCGNINVPITLSYHASGIQASQESTRVGLGWSLNAGGMIGRTIICGDDLGEHSYPPYHAGYLQMPNIRTLNDITTDYCMGGDLIADSEPDLFFFSLPHGGGKFMFSKSKSGQPVPVLVNKQSCNARIDYIPSTHKFNITDDQGTTYVFSTIENTKVFSCTQEIMSRSELETDIDITNRDSRRDFNTSEYPDYTSAWYLDRIVSQQGDTISFEYEQESYQLPLQFSCMVFNITKTQVSGYADLSICPKGKRYTKTKSVLSSPRLTAIKWHHGKVRLEYSKREDLQWYKFSDSAPCKIDRIIIEDVSGAPIKDYRLEQSYFNGGTNSNVPHLYKRLRLDGLRDALVDGYAYGFRYQGGTLPAKNTKNTDSWGFYNGANYGTDFYSEADLDDKHYSGADKITRAGNALLGTLISVTQPTGGETRFEQESNTYERPPYWEDCDKYHIVSTFYGDPADDTYSVYEDYPQEESDTLTFDKKTEVSLSFEYEYVGRTPLKPGSICVDDPARPLFVIRDISGKYLYKFSIPSSILGKSSATGPNQKIYLNPGTYVFSSMHQEAAWDIGADMTIKFKGRSLQPAQTVNAGGIRTRRIVGERTVSYSYENSVKLIEPVQAYPFHIDVTNMSGNHNGKARVDYFVQLSECAHPLATLTGGNIFGYGEVTETFADGTSKVYTYSNKQEEANPQQPFMHTTPNYGNGLLESILTLDSLGNDVQLQEYNYTYKISPDTVHAFHYSFHGSTPILYNYNIHWPVQAYSHTLNYMDRYNEYSANFYDDDCRLRNSETSVGNQHLTKTYHYADDRTDAVSQEMRSRHMVGMPVETYLSTDKGIIRGQKNTYSLNEGKIVTSDEAILQTSVPLAANDCNGKFTQHVRYRNYTLGGNPMYVDNGIMGKVFLWSYADTYPVAEIDGITYGEVRRILSDGFIAALTSASKPTKEQLATVRALQNSLPHANVTTYTYDTARGMTSICSPNGVTKKYEYDAGGKLICVKNTAGKVQERYAYTFNKFQSGSPSSITTITMLDDTGTGKLEKVQYFDGFGRPVQMAYNGVMLGKDGTNTTNRTQSDYDALGREWRTWLPIAGTSLGYASTVTSMARDRKAYYSNAYDALSRPTFVSSPGEDMQGKGKRKEYGTNDGNSVKKYRFSSGGIVGNSFYEKGELRMERITDEEGATLETYTDLLGNKVLERHDGDNDTYYIYNDAGLLTYVLQPMFQEEENLDKFSFRYTYDDRGRMVSKILPGCGLVSYTYDEANRVISMQDGEMRKKGKVRHYEYDNQDRLVTQYTDGIGGKTYEIHNYYDGDYSFVPSGLPNCKDNYSSSATDANLARGLLCGTIQRGSNGTELVSALYYNEDGKLCDKAISQLDGHIRRESYCFNFTNKLTNYNTYDYMDGKEILNTNNLTKYCSYSGQLYQKGITIGYKGKKESYTTSPYFYDKYGRMTTSTDGGVLQHLEYDIRDHLTKLSSTTFTEELFYTKGSSPRFDGNISEVRWKTLNDSISYGADAYRSYEFCYDGLGRMTAAQYGLHASGKTYEDDYSESLSYDANSNIKSIVRMGYVDENDTHFGEVDHLLISHNGNKLAHVESQGNPWALTPHFTKTKDETEEYRFNANGALTIDRNRGIVSIQYDNLGHPCQVLFRDGSYTQYVYAADGTKLRVTHGKAVPGQTLAWGETKMLTADKIQSVNTTDYWGNVLYENGRPTTVLSNGRYVLLNQDSTLTWCSVEKDHLGSNRVVREETSGINRLQINHYYPFGNTFGEYNHCDENTDLQRYKFNGKELDLVHGLRLYDYGARMYDQILGCWTSVDPMAEKYYHISPYVFCADSPVRNIDPNGKEKIDLLDKTDKNYKFFSDDMNNFSDDDGVINIWVHGLNGENGISYEHIVNAESFNKMLKNKSTIWKRHITGNPAIIVLHSCQTSEFAKLLSSDPSFKNVLIVAPNKSLQIRVGYTNKIKRIYTGVSNYLDTDVHKLFLSTGKWLGYENGKLYNEYPGDFKTPQQNSEKPGAKGFVYEPFFLRFVKNLKYWRR